MAVLVVADAPAILHRPRLDEGQGGIVPEVVLILRRPRTAHDAPRRGCSPAGLGERGREG